MKHLMCTHLGNSIVDDLSSAYANREFTRKQIFGVAVSLFRLLTHLLTCTLNIHWLTFIVLYYPIGLCVASSRN